MPDKLCELNRPMQHHPNQFDTTMLPHGEPLSEAVLNQKSWSTRLPEAQRDSRTEIGKLD